jgi:hypothetical protein
MSKFPYALNSYNFPFPESFTESSYPFTEGERQLLESCSETFRGMRKFGLTQSRTTNYCDEHEQQTLFTTRTN